MEGLNHLPDSKFIQRIDFGQSRKDMQNLQHGGDDATEISIKTSTLYESTVMEVAVASSSVMSLSPELKFAKFQRSRERHVSQPRGALASEDKRLVRKNQESSPFRPNLKEILGIQEQKSSMNHTAVGLLKQRKNTEIFIQGRADLDNSSNKKRSQFQSIMNQSKIFSETSHEVWNAAAQSSARDGCPSQSTQNNMHAVSTNQSIVPTPRLPNELLSLENVERAYSAMKAGLQNKEVSPKLVKATSAFLVGEQDKIIQEEKTACQPKESHKEALEKIAETEKSSISGLPQKPDPAAEISDDLPSKILPQQSKPKEQEADTQKPQTIYQFKFTIPTQKTPSMATPSRSAYSSEALLISKTNQSDRISLALTLPKQGNMGKKFASSKGSLTTSNKRALETKKVNFNNPKTKKKTNQAISFSSQPLKQSKKDSSNPFIGQMNVQGRPLYSPQNQSKIPTMFTQAVNAKQGRNSVKLKPQKASLVPSKVASSNQGNKRQRLSISALDREAVLQGKRNLNVRQKATQAIKVSPVQAQEKLKSPTYDSNTDHNSKGITRLIKQIKKQQSQTKKKPSLKSRQAEVRVVGVQKWASQTADNSKPANLKSLTNSLHNKSQEESLNSVQSHVPNTVGQPTFSSRIQSQHNKSNPNFNDRQQDVLIPGGSFSANSHGSIRQPPRFQQLKEAKTPDDFIDGIEKFSDDITDFIKTRDQYLGQINQSGSKPYKALVRELSNDNWHYFNTASRRGKASLSPEEHLNGNNQQTVLQSSVHKQAAQSFATHDSNGNKVQLRNMQTEDATYSFERSLFAQDSTTQKKDLYSQRMNFTHFNESSKMIREGQHLIRDDKGLKEENSSLLVRFDGVSEPTSRHSKQPSETDK